MLDLKGQLDLKTLENQKLEETKAALTQSNHDLSKALENLNLKLKEVRTMVRFCYGQAKPCSHGCTQNLEQNNVLVKSFPLPISAKFLLASTSFFDIQVHPVNTILFFLQKSNRLTHITHFYMIHFLQSRDMQTEMEEKFRNEITAQEKLITLYKVTRKTFSLVRTLQKAFR